VLQTKLLKLSSGGGELLQQLRQHLGYVEAFSRCQWTNKSMNNFSLAVYKCYEEASETTIFQ
jgi:hypothetical protein